MSNELTKQWFKSKIRKNKLQPVFIVCTNCGKTLAEIYGAKVETTKYKCLNCEHEVTVGLRTNL